MIIFIFVFLSFFSKELSEDFLKKYYLSSTKSTNLNLILNSNSSRKELKQKFSEEILNEKIFEETLPFSEEDINSVLNGYSDNRSAQINVEEIKIFEENFSKNDSLDDFKKKRLENSFRSETTFFDINDFSEIENVVISRIEFLKFLLSEKSKEFIESTNKKLKEIKKIEKLLSKLQIKMRDGILENDMFSKTKFAAVFPKYLKLIPFNLTTLFTYLSNKNIYKIINDLYIIKNKYNKKSYLESLKFSFKFEEKNNLGKFIFISAISAILASNIYTNYDFFRKRFFIPKAFFEYSNLIVKKNKIIKEIYESFLKLSVENDSFKFIPETAILKKTLTLENSKKIKNDFYFGYYDRIITFINTYKILEYSNKLNEKYNFEISNLQLPTEVYPFNIYENFLGFIEFSFFKINLIKESLNKEKNKYTIPNFYSYSEEKNNFCFEIKELWHPNYKDFVSNDITLGIEDKRNSLIIAPTGTGKSTFLIQLLAMLIISRTGIVPAEIANINFPSKIFQNIFSYNGTVGSGLSKHMAERVFVKDILSFTEKNKDFYFYLIADEICSGTTRNQTKEFILDYVNKILIKNNISCFLTTHIEEIYENIDENTNFFNIEVLRKGFEDFELTRKLKPGKGFWIEKNEYDIQNEFVRFLAKIL